MATTTTTTPPLEDATVTTTTITEDTNLVRFFLLGVGTLLPFNVFITAKTYFDATLLRRDDDGAAGSTKNNTTGGEEGWFTKDSFENAFSFWYTTTNLATLLALNRMRVFDNTNKRVTYDRLTTYPLVACAVCFFATASLALDDTAKGTVVVSFATFNLVLFGIFTGLVQFGSFALAATRERKFSTAVVSGQALSGVLASLVALTCSGFNFAALYFGLSGVACLLCAKGGRELVLEMKATSSNFFGDDNNSYDGNVRGNVSRQQYAPVAILEEEEEANNVPAGNDLEDNVEEERSNARLVSASAISSSSGAVALAGREEVGERGGMSAEGAADVLPIRKETWLFRFAVFLTFTVTLTAFPAITSSIVTRAEMRSNSSSGDSGNASSAGGDYWTSFLFLLFNLGDLSGRVFEGSSYAQARGLQNVTGQVAFRRSLYRIVFVPVLASCNVNRSGWRIPRVFSLDVFPVLFVFSLGFTNGFNAACSMALGPQTLSSGGAASSFSRVTNEDVEIENPLPSSLPTARDDQKSEEGAFLGTMLSAGIAFGSVVSLLVCGVFTRGGYL